MAYVLVHISSLGTMAIVAGSYTNQRHCARLERQGKATFEHFLRVKVAHKSIVLFCLSLPVTGMNQGFRNQGVGVRRIPKS